jgi:hypothetical protein
LAIGTRIAARHARLFVAGFRLLRAASGHKGRTPTHCYEATREAAMAAFAKSWRRDQLPLLSLDKLFRQRFLVRPFAGRNRVMRIDADVWPTPCVDAHPISCAQRVTLTGKQGTRVVHDALQLREHLTGDKVLAHRHDGIRLKAMLLRLDRQRQQRSAGDE